MKEFNEDTQTWTCIEPSINSLAILGVKIFNIDEIGKYQPSHVDLVVEVLTNQDVSSLTCTWEITNLVDKSTNT